MHRGSEGLLIETMILHRHSRALRRVAEDAGFILNTVRRDPRKILPVAFLAREFSISVRLLWNWIAADLLKAWTPMLGRKRGVTRQAAVRFLNRLMEVNSFAQSDDFRSRAGRPKSAIEKIRRSRQQEKTGEGMKPTEFAKKIGVSRASVIRAIEGRYLEAWKPTPLCHREAATNFKKIAK